MLTSSNVSNLFHGPRLIHVVYRPKSRPDGAAAPSAAPGMRGVGALALGLLAAGCAGGGAEAKELQYPEGYKPGDQVSGTAGEYFRYKHVLVKPPDDDDRRESIRMSEDIRCAACEELVKTLVQRSESLSEDHVMDMFDGELPGPVALTDDPQENRVNQNRKGCNKHFKDELLLQRWFPQKCGEAHPGADASAPAEAGPRPEWCLKRLKTPVSERDADTYSARNEAIWHACESTVGKYGHELAADISSRLEDGGQLAEAAAASCLEAARCAKAPRKARRRRRRRAADQVEL